MASERKNRFGAAVEIERKWLGLPAYGSDIPSGLDRAKVRTLLENAATLGFIDKAVR